ncbi:hypothetical protein ACFLYO_07255 [Chloroflexota bacterium]
MSARGVLTGEETAFAFLMGFGLMLMILALGFGAALGGAVSATVVGTIFALGVVAFVIGLVMWLGILRPWQQFDDINVPLDVAPHDH